MEMDWEKLRKVLCAPFTNIKWRMGNTFKSKANEKYFGNVYAYIETKDIQDRLDEVVGPNNWKNEFIPWHEVEETDRNGNTKKHCSQLCGLSIFDETKKEWITKYDGAQNKDIEGIKSGLTDSIKRAAAQWGIGRDVYAMPQQVVEIYEGRKNVKDEQKFIGKLEKDGRNVYNYYWQYPQNLLSSDEVLFDKNKTMNNDANRVQGSIKYDDIKNDNNCTDNISNNVHTGKLIKADVKTNQKGYKYALCSLQEKQNFCFNFISNDVSISNYLNKHITIGIRKQGTYNIFEKIITCAA